jgi:hypothetical protein
VAEVPGVSGRRLSALFTWRGALVGDDSSASALERHVGLTLSLHMSERGDSAFPSVETLAGECGRSVSTVRGALRELERKGWLATQTRVGRGHTNVYEAVIPDQETRLTQVVSDAADVASTGPADGADSPSHEAPTPSAGEPPAEAETRLTAAGLAEGKPAGGEAENRRERGLNPPGSGDKDVRGRHEDDSSSTPAAAAAASGGLRFRLRRHRVGGELLERALAEPDRAEAWLDLAEREATGNVAGFFRAGIESGDWPSERGAAAGPTADERRRAQLSSLIENLGAEQGADEARCLIDRDWETLTAIERAELHLLVDELVSEQLPPAAIDVPEQEAEVA